MDKPDPEIADTDPQLIEAAAYQRWFHYGIPPEHRYPWYHPKDHPPHGRDKTPPERGPSGAPL